MHEDGPRDFTNRILCDLLAKPDHLRDLVADAVPNLVDGFVFERMKPARQEFLVGNSRLRKPDVLVEVPYRLGDAERLALVCVLLEHQTKADWQIPLKTFLYLAFYWEWQWRTWEMMLTPKVEFALTPILPIVLYTGARPWGSARSLRDLLGPPAAFHEFAPGWQPLFWELAAHSTAELLNGQAAFLQALAIYKAEGVELEEATLLFTTIYKNIASLHDSNRIRWEDLLKFVLGWAQNRRPQAERQSWHELAVELESDEGRKREVKEMSQTIAQSIYQEGKQEGRHEGALAHARSSVLRVGRKHFGEADDSVIAKLNALKDLDHLDRMAERLLEVASWDELFKVE